MLKNPEKVDALEKGFMKSSAQPDFQKALEVFTALWKEAVSLGVLPPEDPLEGIEVDIRVAKIINSCLKNS